MKNVYSVVVLLNGDVWGVWTLNQRPSQTERVDLKNSIKETLHRCEANPDDKYSIQFSDNAECDSFEDVFMGINRSLENHINYG